MSNSRRIAVFYRSDGRCIHDDLDAESSTHPSNKRPTNNNTAAALWPLLKVFMQFSREVQGGAIKRLVFRNPADYTPRAHRFEPAPPSIDPGLPPVVVHVAHDDLFVVAVTEVLSDASNAGRLGLVKHGDTFGVTITNFCTSLLDFLRDEQTRFLRNLKNSKQTDRNLENRDSMDRETNPIEDSGAPVISQHSTSQSTSTRSESTEASNRPVAVDNPVVSIDVARLKEHIAENQNLLRL